MGGISRSGSSPKTAGSTKTYGNIPPKNGGDGWAARWCILRLTPSVLLSATNDGLCVRKLAVWALSLPCHRDDLLRDSLSPAMGATRVSRGERENRLVLFLSINAITTCKKTSAKVRKAKGSLEERSGHTPHTLIFLLCLCRARGLPLASSLTSLCRLCVGRFARGARAGVLNLLKSKYLNTCAKERKRLG